MAASEPDLPSPTHLIILPPDPPGSRVLFENTLVQSMASWHEDGCRRPDVFVNTDNTPMCLSCGSFFSLNDNEATGVLRNDQVVPSDSVRLRLDWPSTVPFSSVKDVNDPALRAILMTLDGDSDDPNEDTEPELKQKAVPDAGNCTVLEDAQGSKPGCRPRYSHENVDRDTIHHKLTEKDEIRLLYLEPCDKEDGILHGELRIVRLSNRPDYTALSYTWADASGDRSLCEKVFVGRAWMPLAITSNCAAALRRLRFKSTTRILWVDAICIDQGSVREKNHQVSVMRDIYSRAQSVVIFLGGGSGTNTPAARLMQRLSDERFRAGKAVLKEWGHVYDPSGVIDLFQHPYWSRIWVIQEVMLAASATLIFGNATLSFQEFVNNFARRLEFNHRSDPLVKSQLPPWIFFDGVSRLGDPAPFFDLLTKTSTCKAEDPRDKVFALLGLVPGAEWQGLLPDYSKTTSEILTGLAAYFLFHGHSSILDAAAAALSNPERQDAEARRSDSKLPSWVSFGQFLSSRDHRDSMRLGRLHDLFSGGEIEGGRSLTWLAFEPTSPSTNPEPRGVFKVFDRCGILLIRALPVVQLCTMRSGFQVLQRACRPRAGWKESEFEARNTTLQWTIHVCSRSTITLEDDWIIAVPGCETFLHIRPSQRAPGTYELASPALIDWTMWRSSMPHGLPEYLKASGSREPSHWAEDYRLWMPLISFELQHLQFLWTWESMNSPDSTTAPSSVSEDELLQSDLDEYAQWMASVRPDSLDQFYGLYPGNDRVVKKVSIYLERWQDLELWLRIRTIFDMPWGQYLTRLDEIRAVVWSRLISEDPTERIFDDLELRLQSLFLLLVESLPGISFKSMTGEHSLGNFSSPGISRDLMTSIRDVPSCWSIDQIRESASIIFSDWNGVKECWDFMRQSKDECDALRIKFVQLHVFKCLRRRQHREFLIS